MDWWLVYCTVDQLAAVAGLIPPTEIAQQRVFTDPVRVIAILEVAKAQAAKKMTRQAVRLTGGLLAVF